jgi:hypothetical protein
MPSEPSPFRPIAVALPPKNQPLMAPVSPVQVEHLGDSAPLERRSTLDALSRLSCSVDTHRNSINWSRSACSSDLATARRAWEGRWSM